MSKNNGTLSTHICYNISLYYGNLSAVEVHGSAERHVDVTAYSGDRSSWEPMVVYLDLE